MNAKVIALIGSAIVGFTSVWAEGIDIAAVSNATAVASYLARFPYPACTTKFPESDFTEREKAVCQIVQKDFMPGDTNALMKVADYLGLSHPLSVENRNADLQNAIRHDRYVQFGDSNYVVRAGIIQLGPTARACQEQYMCRNRYNDHLRQFRISTFRLMQRELMRQRWSRYSEEELYELLNEFYRRANATEAELEKVRLCP